MSSNLDKSLQTGAARPEDVIAAALALGKVRNTSDPYGYWGRAEAALAVLLAERDEREQALRETVQGEWNATVKQAEARAVAAEAERDAWRAKFEHSDNRTHANGPTAIERALRAEAERDELGREADECAQMRQAAEAELETLREALRELADWPAESGNFDMRERARAVLAGVER